MSEPRLDPAIVREQRAWASTESLEFYRTHRRRAEDLYRSERFFLPDVLPRVSSMVDVGCAAGGFSALVKTFNTRIRYVGVDVEPNFVAAARADYPDAEFVHGDGISYSTPPGSFELAHSSGVLHINPRYVDMIAAMWAQTSRFLLCDLRLTHDRPEVGRMESPFGEQAPVSLPYIVLRVADAIDIFRNLSPTPATIKVKGYPHRPNATAILEQRDILMAFFLAEKGGPVAEPRVEVDLNAGGE